MKTIFTLLLSTLFSLGSFAYDGTRLTVTSISNKKMIVEVDGRRYNLDDHTVSLSNLRPGVHTVRVLRELKRRSGWSMGIGSRREEVIYSIKATLKYGYHFDILVNRFGKTMIDERRIDENDDWYDDEDGYYENDQDQDREYDRDDRNYDDDQVYDDKDKDNNHDRTYDDNYSRSMSDRDFSQAKENLRREWMENARLTSAKQVVDANYFTSQQVKELLLLFTFEGNRLDLAKYAYKRTVDKENYYIVNDVFTFNNNKEKLSEYIHEQQ